MLKYIYKNLFINKKDANVTLLEILPNSALFDISNGFIEGNNRNINLYYNRARGFKDIDYFLNLIMYFSYKKTC